MLLSYPTNCIENSKIWLNLPTDVALFYTIFLNTLMAANETTKAKSFTELLQKEGFDAELKRAKDKPSLVVRCCFDNINANRKIILEYLATPRNFKYTPHAIVSF